MNQKATFISHLYEAKVISKSKPTRSAGRILLTVCVCAHCRYTQHIHTAYSSHVEISLKVQRSKPLKKTYSRILFEQNYTVHVLSRHTRRRVLISGRFQEVACDSYCVLTKAVSQHCVARVALLPLGECPMDTVNKARTETPSAVSDKISQVTLVPQLCSDSNHTIIRLTQINCVSACQERKSESKWTEKKRSVDCYRMKLNLFNLLVKMRNSSEEKEKQEVNLHNCSDL